MRAITLQRECLVDLHVAAREAERGIDAQLTLHCGLVHPRLDPRHLLVAKVAIPLTVALLAHVVRVVAQLCAVGVSARTGRAGETHG